MNREQAIEILQSEMPKDLKRENRAQRYDAFMLAIKALKQMPCEDCISRESVLAAYNRMIESGNPVDLRKEVEQMPSVQPKPITSEWTTDANDIAICERCGYMPPYDRAIDDIAYTRFCPECGALMDDDCEE